jgi:hypothetical protein
MYAKGSRYRKLPQSAPIKADGERPLVTELRVIPYTPAQFLHMVRDNERLDLLGYKYYSDATRWWQICDANPQFEFPNDLLDRDPLVDETPVLDHPDALARYNLLLANLATLGTVTASQGGTVSDFVACSVIVAYAAGSTRSQVLSAIAGQQFHLLHTFEWIEGTGVFESFTFEDVRMKASWQQLVLALQQVPGIISVIGDMSAASLQLTYNTAVIERASILTTIEHHGFVAPALLTLITGRVGSQIFVPPNGNL